MKSITINMPFNTYENCELHWAKYNNNNRPALRIFLPTGEPLLTASVNVPEANIPEDHILIKDWSENAGILDELIRHNIVENTHNIVSCGFAVAHLCKIIDPDYYHQ